MGRRVPVVIALTLLPAAIWLPSPDLASSTGTGLAPIKVYAAPWYRAPRGDSKRSFRAVVLGRGYCMGQPEQKIERIRVLQHPRSRRRPHGWAVVTAYIQRAASREAETCADLGSDPIFTRFRFNWPWRSEVLYDGSYSPPRQIWPPLGSQPRRHLWPPACGPLGAPTLIEGRRARIFSLPGSKPPFTERALGCLSSGARSLRLIPSRAPIRLTEPILLHAPWVGGALYLHGLDTYRLIAKAWNLRSAAVIECPAGGGSAVFKSRTTLAKMVLSGRGTLAWSASHFMRRTEFGHEVAICTPTGTQVLDSGEGIDLESLRLHGSTLTWTDAGEMRSAMLH